MLSAYAAETIAYYGEGFVVHDHCAVERYGSLTVEKADAGLTNAYGLTPLSRYGADDWADGEGLSCDHCGLWIIEPDEPEPSDG